MSYKTTLELLEDAKQGILPSQDNCVPPLHQYLFELCHKHEKSMHEVSTLSGISRSQLYTFINGANPKLPNRAQIILILAVLGASLDEVQNALRYGLRKELDPRQPRDSVLIEAFAKQLPLTDMDDMLEQKGFETLTIG